MTNRTAFFHSLVCSVSAAAAAVALSASPAHAQTTTADFHCPDQTRPASAMKVFDRIASFMPGNQFKPSNADVRAAAQQRCHQEAKPGSATPATQQ